MNSFGTDWRKNFQETPPVGWRLNDAFKDRWIRFHALPKSEAYPETPGENAIVLNRANALATELFGDETTVWLATSRPKMPLFSRSYGQKSYTKKSKKLPYAFEWQDMIEEPEDRLKWACFAKQVSWKPREFDDTFYQIANNRDWAIIIVSTDMQTVLAPYEGGFDLILPNYDEVSKLMKKYNAWLSDRADFM